MTTCVHTKYRGCPACPCEITITISKALAYDLANNWQPLDDEDEMIELFDACRWALDASMEEL